jgi:hypothetical protein
LNITAIPGIDQQLPIVNLPGNQLGVSTLQLGGTALVGATIPLYDGGRHRVSLREPKAARAFAPAPMLKMTAI